MNRTLRRPMFRIGGVAEGITSGLAPRQGLAYSGVAGRENPNLNPNTKPDEGTSMMEKLMFNKSMVEALAPRAPRRDTSFNDFLINTGLDLVSRPKGGNIFQQVATSAKEPFAKFQQAKQIEDAYGAKETESDRALIADMIKGINDEELSALMKDVQAGVKSGLFPNEETGIKLLLKKKLYGVLKEPGEIKQDTIETRAGILLERDEYMGYDSAIAIANATQDILDGKIDGVTAEQIDTDQLYIEPATWLYMDTPNKDTGIYTLPENANDGDKNDFNETYTDGMIYYNYRNKIWYQKSGKQFLPIQQSE